MKAAEHNQDTQRRRTSGVLGQEPSRWFARHNVLARYKAPRELVHRECKLAQSRQSDSDADGTQDL